MKTMHQDLCEKTDCMSFYVHNRLDKSASGIDGRNGQHVSTIIRPQMLLGN